MNAFALMFGGNLLEVVTAAIVGAFLAISCFAIMLETPKKYIVYAGIVGAVGWFVFLFTGNFGANDVFATFLSALTIAFISHVFARIFKTPVTGFLIAGILPTVPGAGMYHIGYYMFQNDMDMMGYYITSTLQIAGVIAAAIFIMDALFRLFLFLFSHKARMHKAHSRIGSCQLTCKHDVSNTDICHMAE